MIKGRCFLIKETGWSTNYPSYIQIWLKILIIIFFYQKLSFSKENNQNFL